MDQLFSSFNTMSNISPAKVFNMSDYHKDVQKHLANVYLALVACLISTVVGVGASMQFNLGGGYLGLIGTFGMLFWIQMDTQKNDLSRRLAMLCGFGFFQGISVAPLMQLALFVDPAIVMTAFIGAVTVFACFSAAALTAQRRSYLFLGGILSSAITLMCVLGLINMFFMNINVYLFNLYVGLLVFSGYVIFDTQMILEKAELGSRDVIGHAMELYIDFMAILIRIIIILLRNSEKKSKSEKKSSHR
jgi:Bax inhibitor 1